MIAVCFPKADIENEFPHMTLMLGDKSWKANNSNTVLKATCSGEFKHTYSEKNEE